MVLSEEKLLIEALGDVHVFPRLRSLNSAACSAGLPAPALVHSVACDSDMRSSAHHLDWTGYHNSGCCPCLFELVEEASFAAEEDWDSALSS